MARLGLRRLGAIDGARGRIDGMAVLGVASGGMGSRMVACERRADFFSAFLSPVVGAGRRHWLDPAGPLCRGRNAGDRRLRLEAVDLGRRRWGESSNLCAAAAFDLGEVRRPRRSSHFRRRLGMVLRRRRYGLFSSAQHGFAPLSMWLCAG